MMSSQIGTPITLDTRNPTMPAMPAMIVVDMQNAFLDDQGSVATMGLDITYLKQTVGPVMRLVEACHDAGVPIIFTRYVLRADYTDAGLREERRPGACASASLVAGTWDADVDPRMDVGHLGLHPRQDALQLLLQHQPRGHPARPTSRHPDRLWCHHRDMRRVHHPRRLLPRLQNSGS